MPKLDKKGPEGKGAGTGRKLGKCMHKWTEEENKNTPEVGKGLRRKVGGGKGQGKRLRSFFRCP